MIVECVFPIFFERMQIEWLTAGDCIAGMHEVVVTKRTAEAIKVAQEQNCSLWRVSSTVSDGKVFAIFSLNAVIGCNFSRLNFNSKNPANLLFSCSQLFAHVASDAVLRPLGHFAGSPLAVKYPPICAGEFVEKELAVINLKGNKGEP